MARFRDMRENARILKKMQGVPEEPKEKTRRAPNREMRRGIGFRESARRGRRLRFERHVAPGSPAHNRALRAWVRAEQSARTQNVATSGPNPGVTYIHVGTSA